MDCMSGDPFGGSSGVGSSTRTFNDCGHAAVDCGAEATRTIMAMVICSFLFAPTDACSPASVDSFVLPISGGEWPRFAARSAA